MAYSPAHIGAFRKGQAAARAGKTRKDCPYKEPAFMAGGRGLKITSHAFRDKWLAGFNSIKGKT